MEQVSFPDPQSIHGNETRMEQGLETWQHCIWFNLHLISFQTSSCTSQDEWEALGTGCVFLLVQQPITPQTSSPFISALMAVICGWSLPSLLFSLSSKSGSVPHGLLYCVYTLFLSHLCVCMYCIDSDYSYTNTKVCCFHWKFNKCWLRGRLSSFLMCVCVAKHCNILWPAQHI